MKLTTQAAQQAFDKVAAYKNQVSEKTFQHMTEGIKNFDGLCQGFGFDAMQAQHKLKRIAELTIEEIQAIDHYCN
jgi:inosine/xanthosine triphosphate pyrophosphatase family protein